MSYVMVPVPEEHVAEFNLGVMRLTLGLTGWEDRQLVAFVAGLEPAGRALVREVATVSAEQDRLPYEDAARSLGIDVGAVLDLVTDINDRCRRAGLPLPLVTDTLVTTTEREERAKPVLAIVPIVAKAIVSAMESDGGG